MIPKLNILKVDPNQPGLFEPQESYDFIKCLECQKSIVKVWDYYTNKYNEDNKNLYHYYNDFCCKKCLEYFEEIDIYQNREEQEINERDQILEIEYIANIKKTEPKSSSLVKIKIVTVDNWDYNEKLQKSINHKTKEKKYVTNCGEQYEYISHTLTQCTELHKDCRVCKLIAKMSKATKLNDNEILKLFQNIEKLDHKVESRNYILEDNCLYHRRDLEFIKRKKDKLIINNSQEIHINFGGYFGGRSVCCPRFWKYPFNKRIVRLPLTQIKEVIKTQIDLPQLVEKIDIIEDKEFWSMNEINGTLIKVFNKYLWFKRDEAQECLIVLPCKVTSIKQAVECLKPKLLENKTKGFTRIGDYFFIETKEDFKQYNKSHYEISSYEIIEHYGNSQAIAEVKTMLIEFLKDKIEDKDTLKDIEQNRYLRVLEDLCNKANSELYKNNEQVQAIFNKILKEVKPISHKGNLVKYPIYDSNHIASNSYNIGLTQLVKGFIYHKSREHRRVKLDKWHLVFKNEAIESFNVSAQGAYRD